VWRGDSGIADDFFQDQDANVKRRTFLGEMKRGKPDSRIKIFNGESR